MNRAELFELHKSLCDKGLEIMRAKNQDYAGKSGDSPFQNFERSEVLGIPRELGLLVRVMDKICRIKSFIEAGTLAVKGEPVDDAILDIINYMVLLNGMIEETRIKKLQDEINALRTSARECVNVRVDRVKVEPVPDYDESAYEIRGSLTPITDMLLREKESP